MIERAESTARRAAIVPFLTSPPFRPFEGRENVVDMAGDEREGSHPNSGHRIVANADGFVIESFGASPTASIAEALSGLVEEFAVLSDQPSARLLPLSETKGAGEDALVQLLEEVIDALDVFAVVPIRFHLAETEDGGIAGDMEVVPARAAEIIGPKPKGVSHHGLSIVHGAGTWRCRVQIEA